MTSVRPTTKRSSNDERDSIERFFDQLDELLIYRWPHVFGPLLLAGVALGGAQLAHVFEFAWAATVVAVVVFLIGMGCVPDLPGKRERTYATACWVGGTSWVILASWLGPFSGPALGLALGPWRPPLLFLAWFLLLAFGWPPYFKHRRVRRGVRVSAEILAWDGDAVGLTGVELVTASGKADKDGWSARLRISPKGRYTLTQLRNAIPRIAARYNAAISDVEINPVREGKEGEYELQIRETPPDPSSPYECPAERPSLREPFRVGRLNQGGGPMWAEVHRPGHGGVDGLCCGQKGGGKSTYFKRLALHTVASHDGLSFLADMKPGSPDYHSIGGRGAYVYATTQAEVDLMVRALLVLCGARGRNKRNRKVIVFQLDESSLYFRPTEPASDDFEGRKAARRADQSRQALWENLIAISRSFDISIRVATQQGKESRLGNARSHLLSGEVVGFFSPKSSDSALLSSDQEFNLASLPRGVPGEVLLANGQHSDVVRGRLDNVTDAAVREVLKRFATGQGDLEDDEIAALEAELGAAWGELRRANRRRPPATAPRPDLKVVDGSAEPAEDITPAEGEEEAPKRLTADQSRDLVWNALAEFDKPVYVRDVAKLCEKSEEIVRTRLKELVDEERAVQHSRGRWVKFEARRPALDTAEPVAAGGVPATDGDPAAGGDGPPAKD